jgi:hypothetical protein
MPVGRRDVMVRDAGPGLRAALEAFAQIVAMRSQGLEMPAEAMIPEDPVRDRALAEVLGLVGRRVQPRRPEEQRVQEGAGY